MNIANIIISNHAKQRYAERVRGKEAIDIAIYMRQNEEKIRNDITKMVDYGKAIYSGKSIISSNKNDTDIYVNGTWIIIVDSKTNVVITLYQVDLGLGQDFTTQYVDKMVEKLENAKRKLKESDEKIVQQRETYTTLIEENTGLIAKYKSIIDALEEQNRGYNEVLSSINVSHDIAEQEVREIIGTLIGKKVY